MKFDPRRASRPQESNKKRGGAWDLRDYRVRKNRIKGVDLRGKPITKEVLKIFGEELVKGVREEAKRASGLGTGIPSTKSFLDSFYYEIVEGGKIRIKSDWRWVKAYLERREPYQMTWLTREAGSKRVIPIKTKSGEVEFRSAPLKLQDAWVHPAIAKFNFIDSGIKKGEKRAISRASQYMAGQIRKDRR